jgi:hypothetical protein
MNKSHTSIFVFGLYLILVVGIGFMSVPMSLLGLFGLHAGDDVWIRFVGMLASIIGAYYVFAARAGLDQFLPWTVIMRFYASAFMLLMFVLGKLGAPILLFAAIDTAGAVWTWLAVRSERS